MRTAYRCRAYPDDAQQQVLARTFGCVRLVWNRTLAERHRLYHTEGKSLSYAASDAALTVMKQNPELAFLNEVSSVPLQQALRHQYKAFSAFFAKRARYAFGEEERVGFARQQRADRTVQRPAVQFLEPLRRAGAPVTPAPRPAPDRASRRSPAGAGGTSSTPSSARSCRRWPGASWRVSRCT